MSSQRITVSPFSDSIIGMIGLCKYYTRTFLLIKTFFGDVRGTIPLFPLALATHATPLERLSPGESFGSDLLIRKRQ